MQWNFINVLFVTINIFFQNNISRDPTVPYKLTVIEDDKRWWLIYLMGLEFEVFLAAFSSNSFIFWKNKWIWNSECISHCRQHSIPESLSNFATLKSKWNISLLIELFCGVVMAQLVSQIIKPSLNTNIIFLLQVDFSWCSRLRNKVVKYAT
jgi:hypothetical protein